MWVHATSFLLIVKVSTQGEHFHGAVRLGEDILIEQRQATFTFRHAVPYSEFD